MRLGIDSSATRICEGCLLLASRVLAKRADDALEDLSLREITAERLAAISQRIRIKRVSRRWPTGLHL